MNRRERKHFRTDEFREAIDEIGGEPLKDSGFEDETPDPEYVGAVVLPSMFIAGTPRN